MGASWKAASAAFPVLLLSGPRQVGKTTLLRSLSSPDRRYLSLDDLSLRRLAQDDPALFLDRFEPPVLLDEVQYAPQLFSAIKARIDANRRQGDYWLTGSQPFHLMKGVSESLAGRIAIGTLLGLSEREVQRGDLAVPPFTPDRSSAEAAFANGPEARNHVFDRIWRGALPGVAFLPTELRDVAISAYVQTYLERDVRELLNVGSLLEFDRFLRAVAVRTGTLLNVADLARDVRVAPATAKAWLSVLEASGIILLLPPWSSNATNRVVKTPKLYFLDTGVAAWLGGWPTADSLQRGAAAGAFFETWVVAEILKSWWNRMLRPHLYFYRDHDGREVDVVFDRGGELMPVEIKLTSTPDASDARHFAALDRVGKRGRGVIVCLVEREVALGDNVVAVSALGL